MFSLAHLCGSARTGELTFSVQRETHSWTIETGRGGVITTNIYGRNPRDLHVFACRTMWLGPTRLDTILNAGGIKRVDHCDRAGGE